MIFRQMFEPVSSTYTYLLADPTTGEAALIDPVVEELETYVRVLGELDLTRSGDRVRVGSFEVEVRETPGHTDGCVAYVAGDRVFTGDTLLIGGCGRTDFQQGSSEKLYDSVHTQLFSLPPDTLVYPAHDYKGRTVSTIREEMASNARLGGGRSKADFVALMGELRLAYPKQIDRAVPANQRCGLETL